MRNYKLIFWVFSLLFFPFSQNFGQCPNASGDGIHYVQKGETLYSLSRKYDCSVTDICDWNGIKKTSPLKVCQRLKVSSESITDAVPTNYETRQVPKGGGAFQWDTGEKRPKARKQEGRTHIVRRGETVTALADMYGYAEWRFREINGLSPGDQIYVGQELVNTECECALRKNSNRITNASDQIRENSPVAYEASDAAIRSLVAKGSSGSSSAYSFMSQTELDMVDEINLVRTDPEGYIPIIEKYISKLRAQGRYGTAVQSASELIGELRRTPQLSHLTPTECLYNAAKNHGQDRLRIGTNAHRGSDGSMPWDRVRRACPQMDDGNENLVGGHENVRDAVIALLVDDGSSTRGHRRTLLNPKWNHVACYKIGQVGYMPDSWVQKFGD